MAITLPSFNVLSFMDQILKRIAENAPFRLLRFEKAHSLLGKERKILLDILDHLPIQRL